MSRVTIVRVELVQKTNTSWGNRYRVWLDQEIYLKFSKVERDYIYTDGRDELEAWRKADQWLTAQE